MEDFDFQTVRELKKERAEKAKKVLPVKKSAQKESLRDYLARNQELFEEKMLELAEYDPKTFCTIHSGLMKHMIPKQSEVSVTHGLDEDFKQLAAMGMTKVSNDRAIDMESVPKIQDADFEELNDLGNGTGN